MAKVDFHSQVKDKVHYSCRLMRKILSLSAQDEPFQRIVVLGDQKVLDDLDERLWTFSHEDFLPHSFAFEDSFELSPIVLTSELKDHTLEQIPHDDVLLHLGQNPLENIVFLANHFKRVIEVVSIEPVDLNAGRQRFKTYRGLGVELQNFDQKGNV